MLETLSFTLRIIKKRPLRSLLTFLQVGLGVWIVAIILSLNLGTSGGIAALHSTYGNSLAKITVSRFDDFEGQRVMVAATNNLRYEDLARLQESDYIEKAFIFQELWLQRIRVGGAVYSVQLAAETTADYAAAVGLELVEGQFFTKADEEQQNRVVLISDVVAKQLFPNQRALGQIIDLGDFGEGSREFEVIGVYKQQSPLLDLFISEAYLLYPLGTTGVSFSLDDFEPTYQNIYIKSQPGKIYEAVEDARILLAHRSLDDLEVNGQYLHESTRWMADQVNTMGFFLGAFAFIAVVVSAIGILSIMLVSVVERTREIGLRQALGASKRSIIGQILNESLVFSLGGSILGLLAALATARSMLSAIVEEIMYRQFSNIQGLNPLAAALAALIAVLMGQLFALYPAWQAAHMAPVDALREG